MRVSSGHLRGRPFDAPSGNRTHPMSERVKTALFNILGDVSGAEVLDAYAGSGALSFEAISRGARSSLAIDIDKAAYDTIVKNIEQLGLAGKVRPIRANAASWSEKNPELLFDLIVLDPPYGRLNLSTVERLSKHLKPKGLMVLSHVGSEATPTVNGVVVVDNRIYGDAALSFYRLDGAG